MQRPSDPERKARLDEALRHLRKNVYFEEFVSWVADQRDLRDAENRVVGKENQYSEAHALTVILDAIDAA